ncbi:hypothetical protein [Bacillus haynesii]|uniref:hypothetical protein n=1 Tax=Bacillus haynesii TaxID=1925021 RepID=UPI00227F940C|nr:hypothetical protein [Bacillus haynesii]MCY8408981.1 hypothetical protein [Bacillus haynesii]MCY8433470.1 hypothetical protein [Bacillus haynesii]MCY8557850.1 hypothetical protein [Bacillus haynesii]
MTEKEVREKEQFEQLKQNILSLSRFFSDIPITQTTKGANFAVEKILEGTGITIESLIEESNKKDWFKP